MVRVTTLVYECAHCQKQLTIRNVPINRNWAGAYDMAMQQVRARGMLVNCIRCGERADLTLVSRRYAISVSVTDAMVRECYARLQNVHASTMRSQ